MNWSASPSKKALIGAFAAVYTIWGSTYLAIRFAIETIPPFTMGGIRFLMAGGILYAWARARGAGRPKQRHWRGTAVVGALLLLGGNGAVVWAEQWVASGVVALLVASVPLWMVLMDWSWGGGRRPNAWLVGGLLWGLLGVAFLVGSEEMGGGSTQTLLGALVVLAGSFSWAAGSIYSRTASLPPSPSLATAMEMLVGGGLLLLLGGVVGEWGTFSLAAISLKSLLSLAYLIVFGAIVAFSAYIWLLRVSTPARVATYAYVNPVVALILGWGLASESLDSQALLAGGIILSAVWVISVHGSGGSPASADADAHDSVPELDA